MAPNINAALAALRQGAKPAKPVEKEAGYSPAMVAAFSAAGIEKPTRVAKPEPKPEPKPESPKQTAKAPKAAKPSKPPKLHGPTVRAIERHRAAMDRAEQVAAQARAAYSARVVDAMLPRPDLAAAEAQAASEAAAATRREAEERLRQEAEEAAFAELEPEIVKLLSEQWAIFALLREEQAWPEAKNAIRPVVGFVRGKTQAKTLQELRNITGQAQADLSALVPYQAGRAAKLARQALAGLTKVNQTLAASAKALASQE